MEDTKTLKAQVEQHFATLVQDITSLSNTNPDSLLKKSSKIGELLQVVDEWKSIIEKAQKAALEEKQAINTYVRQIDEKLEQVRKSLLPGSPGPSSQAVLKPPVPAASEPEVQEVKRIDNIDVLPAPPGIKILKRSENEWVNVVHKQKKNSGPGTPGNSNESGKEVARVATISTTQAQISALVGKKNMPVDREVAPGVYAPAFTIEKPEHCHSHLGWLCYNPDTERFYISINGEILSGNTTVINSADKVPYKFNEHNDCAVGKGHLIDYRTTNFYIPPECNPASRDIPQLTNRMRYVPASEQLTKADRYTYRLGSRDYAKADLEVLEPKDFRLFQALTSNFLLHFIVAAREMRRRK